MHLYMILCGVCNCIDMRYFQWNNEISACVSLTLSLLDLVHLPAVIQEAAAWRDTGVISASVGDNGTLHCFYDSQVALQFSCYRQTLGGGPELLSSVYKYDSASKVFHWMEKNPRFSVQRKEPMNHLHISDVYFSDWAAYFWRSSHSNMVEFGEGGLSKCQWYCASLFLWFWLPKKCRCCWRFSLQIMMITLKISKITRVHLLRVSLSKYAQRLYSKW